MNTSSGNKIGVFDSSLGGLTILRGIMRELPEYEYIYLGDTARAPYGNRSEEIVLQYAEQAINFLFDHGARIVILACNTASAEALHHLQIRYPDRKILGVLIPAAEEVISVTQSKRVGVIATASTVASRAFIREIKKLNSTVEVFQQACPLLVPFVEANETHPEALGMVVESYIRPLLQHNIDTLVLGCTHYEYLLPSIQNILPSSVHIVRESVVVARKFKDYLTRHTEIESDLGRGRSLEVYSTDYTDAFAQIAERFFGKSLEVHTVELS